MNRLNVFSLTNGLTDDGEKRFRELRPDVKLEKHAPGSPRYVRGAGAILFGTAFGVWGFEGAQFILWAVGRGWSEEGKKFYGE